MARSIIYLLLYGSLSAALVCAVVAAMWPSFEIVLWSAALAVLGDMAAYIAYVLLP
jgi:hypothetical protein